jgi:phage gp46-like protein
MADIRVVWSPELMTGQWLLKGNVLDITRELPTALAVALFTDRLARADDRLPVTGSSRRGWWGDMDAEVLFSGWPIGSRLWLLSREKQTTETRNRAYEYIKEAIDPLVSLGVMSSYDLVVDWFAFERLGAEITCYGSFGSIAVRFESLWTELTTTSP